MTLMRLIGFVILRENKNFRKFLVVVGTVAVWGKAPLPTNLSFDYFIWYGTYIMETRAGLHKKLINIRRLLGLF